MSSSPSHRGLLRVFGLITGLAITFGGIVSLGILRAPGENNFDSFPYYA